MADDTQNQPSNGVGSTTIQAPEKVQTVPSFRLSEEVSKRDKAFAQRDDAIGQLEKMRAEMDTLRGQLTSRDAQHNQEMHLIDQGFKAPSVRRFFRREYQAAVAELPDGKRPEFGDWLSANREDPLYSVHFGSQQAQQAAQAPVAPGQAQGPATDEATLKALIGALRGNPDAGTGQAKDHVQTDWTDAGELKKLRARNNGTLGKHAAEVLAAWRAKGVIK